MLVLDREVNEEIVLLVPGHEPVRIALVRIGSYKARLGIQADATIKIVRPDQPGASEEIAKWGKPSGPVGMRNGKAVGA